MEAAPDTERTCIIVLQTTQHGAPLTTGVLVDSVAEVVDIAESQIEEAPTLGGEVHNDFIHGIGKIAQKIVLLLEVDSILTFEAEAIQYHRVDRV
jgi:purine-binding chemotaxis protein CheW